MSMHTKRMVILNNKETMDIIMSTAQDAIAQKFDTPREIVGYAIAQKDEAVIGMMKRLVELGIDTAVEELL